MKYILLITAALIMAGSVSAEDQSVLKQSFRIKGESNVEAKDLKEIIKTRREEVRARIASTTEEIKIAFDENKKNRIKQRIENVSGKFDGAIARMEAFDIKVGIAINRFNEKNVSTSDAEELLTIARELLSEVKKNADEFDVQVKAIVESDEVSRRALKEAAEVVKQSIKDAHAAYVLVVAELRVSGGNIDIQATSTATSTDE